MSKTSEKAIKTAGAIFDNIAANLAAIAATTRANGVSIGDISANGNYSEEYKTELTEKENTKAAAEITNAAVNVNMALSELKAQTEAILNATDILDDGKLSAALLVVKGLDETGITPVKALINQFKGDFASLDLLAATAGNPDIKAVIFSSSLNLNEFEGYSDNIADYTEKLINATRAGSGADPQSGARPDMFNISVIVCDLIKVISELSKFYGVDFAAICEKNAQLAAYMSAATEAKYRRALGL